MEQSQIFAEANDLLVAFENWSKSLKLTHQNTSVMFVITGVILQEYISLFADHVSLGLGPKPRTPLQMYRDWFKAFLRESLGRVIGRHLP